ncbi:MAG: TonB-dependent receptor [Acidobacteria bacterium]|nr:TonB-dependent receptor [Acidobacteriota bacterium]
MNRSRLTLFGRLGATAALAVALLFATAPPGAAQAAGGDLAGRAVDKSGAVLPGVTITATQSGTGLERSTVTGADGTFHLASLPVGSYTVKAELQGFGTVTVENVEVNVATRRNLEISISQAAVQEAITVVDEAPLIQNEVAVGTVVSQKELESLPLNGRQFANLGVLAPGTTLGHNTDPTKPGQLVVELNGGIGRNVNYTIDGGDNTDDTIGGALQNFNLDGVQEFKIQTMQYKAEYGRSTGGVLSVVTKSGTNQFKGSGYGYFRDTSLDSRTESEKLADAPKESLSRKQYGGSVGGPVVPDKVHFFATWERTDRNTNYIVESGGIFPSLDGSVVPVPFKDELGTGKLSYDISAKQFLQVRYGYQKNSDKYGASPSSAPSALGTISNDYKSLLAGHSFQIGSDTLNEALFQYSKFSNAITADSNQPFIYFPNGFVSGQNINTPQHTFQTKYQYKDDFSFTSSLGGSRHDFKTGFNVIHEPVLSGDFTTGTTGQFNALTNSPTSPISSIQIFGGFSGQKTPVDEYSVYVQDDWAASNRLTVNIGLRYDRWTGFDLDQRSNPIWQTLSTQTQFNTPALRPFQGGQGGVLKEDSTDFAPRLGITWDTQGDGKHLLRAGYGIYYDFPYTNATILFPAGAVQSSYGVIYSVFDPNGIKNPDGSFFHPGQPLPPNQLPGAQIPPPNEVAAPNLVSKTPRSYQGSLGYSWQVTDTLGINIEGVDVEYRDIPFRFRANIDPATLTPLFPQYGNFRIWTSGGKNTYRGANLGFHLRLPGNKVTLQGFYTYSKATGITLAGADEFRITDRGYQSALARDTSIDPSNPLCGACTGPLDTDARHRVSFGAVYSGPWGIGVSAMFRYHSGTPFMEDIGGTNRILILPPGIGLNAGRTGSFEQFDLRLSKDTIIYKEVGLELIAEAFNLFNAKNPANYSSLGVPHAYAGDPNQGEQRLLQLGVRLHF